MDNLSKIKKALYLRRAFVDERWQIDTEAYAVDVFDSLKQKLIRPLRMDDSFPIDVIYFAGNARKQVAKVGVQPTKVHRDVCFINLFLSQYILRRAPQTVDNGQDF